MSADVASGSTSSTPTGAERRLVAAPSTPWWSAVSAGPTVFVVWPVEVRTDDPDLRFAPGAVLITDPPERGPLTIVDKRWHSGTLLLQLAGPSGEATHARGRRRAAQHPLPRPVGRSPGDRGPRLLLRPPAGRPDRAAARRDGPGRGDRGPPRGPGPAGRPPGRAAPEALIPFVSAIVPTVDLAGGCLVVDPPEGLLDL